MRRVVSAINIVRHDMVSTNLCRFEVNSCLQRAGAEDRQFWVITVQNQDWKILCLFSSGFFLSEIGLFLPNCLATTLILVVLYILLGTLIFYVLFRLKLFFGFLMQSRVTFNWDGLLFTVHFCFIVQFAGLQTFNPFALRFLSYKETCLSHVKLLELL